MSRLRAWFWLPLLSGLGLDILTKQAIMARFALGETLPLLPGVALTYVRNPGASFSLLADADPAWRVPFFFVVTVVALIAVGWSLRELDPRDKLSRVGLGLIASGALGNVFDRLRFHEVVDFLELGVRGVYTWPIFNVADSAVSVGVGLLLLRALRPLSDPPSDK